MFLERWSYIIDSISPERTHVKSPFHSLFSSKIHQPANPQVQSNEQNQMICEFYVPITRELSDAGTHTILGALETLIWWGDIPACLKSFSDILLIRLQRDDREGGAGVEILPNLPLGRFAFDFYEQTMERIQLRREIEDALVKLKRKEESLSWTERNG